VDLNVVASSEEAQNVVEINAKKTKEKKSQLKQYTHEEVLKASTEYFNGDALAANVWMNKYALKDSAGNIYELTPEEMHRRLAS